MKALISVPRNDRVIPLAQCLQKIGFEITCPPNTAMALQARKIACQLVIAPLSSVDLDAFHIVIVDLPDIDPTSKVGGFTQEDMSGCSILFQTAHALRVAAVAHEGEYGQIISELETHKCIEAATRYRLALQALSLASEWIHHAARYHRHHPISIPAKLKAPTRKK